MDEMNSGISTYAIYEFDPPESVSAVNEEGGIRYTFKKVSGATKYAVYIKTDNGTWVRTAEITNDNYLFTGLVVGTKYYFTVRCIYDDGTFASDFIKADVMNAVYTGKVTEGRINIDGFTPIYIVFDGENIKKWIHDDVVVFQNATTVYYYDGSRLIGTKEYEEGQSVLNPGLSTSKSGYTFKGWSKTNGGSVVSSLTASGETMNVYAVYQRNTTTVYYYDGTKLMGSETFYEGNSVLNPSTVSTSKSNYTFVGWSKSDGGTVLTTLTASGSVMYLYAVYKIATTTVYYYNGSTYLGYKKVNIGSDVLRPSGITPTMDGNHTFVGWSQTSSGTRVTSLTASGSTMYLYAQFVPNELTVVSGHITNKAYWYDYAEDSRNSEYFTGDAYEKTSGQNYDGSSDLSLADAYGSFVVKTLGIYQYALVTIEAQSFNSGYLAFSYGSTDYEITGGSTKQFEVTPASGKTQRTCYICAKGVAPAGSWSSQVIGIKSLVLSKPKAWS